MKTTPRCTRSVRMILRTVLLAGAVISTALGHAQAQTKKPNILIIWGDDVGMYNISDVPQTNGEEGSALESR